MRINQAAINVRVMADGGFASSGVWPWQNKIGTIIEMAIHGDAHRVKIKFDEEIMRGHIHTFSLDYLVVVSPEQQEQMRRQEHAMRHF